MRKEVTGMGYCYTKDFIDNDELRSYIVQNYGYFKEIHDDFIGVSIVAHYPVMIDLVNDLIKHTSFTLENIELYDSEVDGYCDEYILTLDCDRKIWVQKALIPKNKYNDGGYVLCDEDLILVHEDVNSKFLIRNSEANIVVFSVENDGEEDNAEENTEDDEIGCDTECTEDNNCLLQMTYMVLHFQKRMISQQEDVRSGVLKNQERMITLKLLIFCVDCSLIQFEK